MSYVSTPQPMGVQGRKSFSLYPTKVRRWRPMTFLDHEWLSFVPQSHAERTKSYNYANYLQKRRRDWGERGKRMTAEVLMSFELPVSAKQKFQLVGYLPICQKFSQQKKPQSVGISPLFARRFEIRWGTEKMF